jgi:putative transposase
MVAVDPADTSQDCSGCGHRNADLTLADRTSPCSRCGLVMDRDRNAGRNILARGTAVMAAAASEVALGRQCLPSG